jgi:hypothetical protein
MRGLRVGGEVFGAEAGGIKGGWWRREQRERCILSRRKKARCACGAWAQARKGSNLSKKGQTHEATSMLKERAEKGDGGGREGMEVRARARTMTSSTEGA